MSPRDLKGRLKCLVCGPVTTFSSPFALKLHLNRKHPDAELAAWGYKLEQYKFKDRVQKTNDDTAIKQVLMQDLFSLPALKEDEIEIFDDEDTSHVEFLVHTDVINLPAPSNTPEIIAEAIRSISNLNWKKSTADEILQQFI